MLNLPAGLLDLIGIRTNAAPDGSIVAERGVVRRGLNPPSGASNAVIDFNGAESFPVTTSTWTFGNSNGESFGITQHFTTAGGSIGTITTLPGIDRSPTTRTIYGIPVAQTVAGDLHQVAATIATLGPIRATRQIIAYARTIADRTVNFGPALPNPSIGVVAGAPAGRLRVQGTLPTEYTSGVSLDVTQTSTARFATVHASRGFLGGGPTYDVQIPDLTGVIGWDTQFPLRTGSVAQWWVSGGGPVLDFFDARYPFNSTHVRWTGTLTGITAPADGATYLMGRTSGMITP